jgi:hypothetical protein
VAFYTCLLARKPYGTLHCGWKVRIIEELNPTWSDLYGTWNA